MVKFQNLYNIRIILEKSGPKSINLFKIHYLCMCVFACTDHFCPLCGCGAISENTMDKNKRNELVPSSCFMFFSTHGKCYEINWFSVFISTSNPQITLLPMWQVSYQIENHAPTYSSRSERLCSQMDVTNCHCSFSWCCNCRMNEP